MSLQDSLFAEDVEYDVNLFLKDNRKKRVLVFPPVNNYRRYLIHQLVQDRFADFLRTFSIGQGLDRRTVVCYKTDVIREPGSNAGEHKESPTKNLSCGMGVVERRSPPKSPERIRPQQQQQQQHHYHHHHHHYHHHQQQQQQQQRQTEPRIVSNSKSIAPAVEIYVPPPARKARNELRSQPRETLTNIKTEDGNDNNDITVLPSTSSFMNVRNNRQRRPDRAVYVPRHRRSVDGEIGSRRIYEDNLISQDSSRSTLITGLSSNSNVICEEQQELRQQQQQQQQEQQQQQQQQQRTEEIVLSSSKLNNVTERLTSNILEKDNSSTNRDHSPHILVVDSSKLLSVKVKENTEEEEEKRQAVKLLEEEEQEEKEEEEEEEEKESTISKTDDCPTHEKEKKEEEEEAKEKEEEKKETVKAELLLSDDTLVSSEERKFIDDNNKEVRTKELLLLSTEEQEEEGEEEESIEIFTNVQSSSSCEKERHFNDKTRNNVEEKEEEEFVESEIVNKRSIMSNNVERDEPIENVELDRNETIVKNNNDSNNTIRQNTMVSNVLIISDVITDKESPKKVVKEVVPVPVTVAPPEKKAKKVERAKSKPAPPPSPPIKISRDECDWDSLFDDNGDCLDPSLIEELTSAVGEVMIEQPKNDYKIYTKQVVEVSSDEFAHVVEIYNFPSDFKTSDLAAVFSPFKTGGFELKWVDDTHCLGVFSSPLIAAEVLASEHPFVKTRPLSEATALSKTKVRKSAEFLQPYRSRPETCAALARRLVTGALGVKLATARQEREHEKNVLREAKEKRRLANKQREDAWEGIIPQK